ncbi:MAG: cytochrome b5 domain-containing protein [Clostridiaceae bacterium]
MRKIFSILMIMFLGVTILAGCGTTNTPTQTPMETPVETTVDTEPLSLTLEELAKFDGMNGNKAYIAIDGKIYDVTDIPQWKGGKHNGYTAGKDLTNEMKTIAPHKLTPLEKLTPIGTIKN